MTITCDTCKTFAWAHRDVVAETICCWPLPIPRTIHGATYLHVLTHQWRSTGVELEHGNSSRSANPRRRKVRHEHLLLQK